MNDFLIESVTESTVMNIEPENGVLSWSDAWDDVTCPECFWEVELGDWDYY